MNLKEKRNGSVPLTSALAPWATAQATAGAGDKYIHINPLPGMAPFFLEYFSFGESFPTHKKLFKSVPVLRWTKHMAP